MNTLYQNESPIRMRNYGRVLQQMIQVAAEEPNQEVRERMTIYIARSMRAKNLTWNKDQETSITRIKEDILTLSNGRLTCEFPTFEQEYQKATPQPQNQSKKKK